MNYKKYISISIMMACLLSVCTGLVMYNYGKWKKGNNVVVTKNLGKSDGPVMQTSSKDEEKVLPTARIKMTQLYKKCGHTTLNEYSVPEEIVNMTEEQVKKYYFGWNLDSFSSDVIEISKSNIGICDEHYVVRDVDGFVSVFCFDDSNNEELVYGTEVATKYLPKEDREKLINGIKIVGKDNLSMLMQDYE